MSDRVAAVVAFVFVGLMLLVLLWPTAANGKRLLRKWEVPDPAEPQVQDAVRYLKRRRLLYPWLYPAIGYFTPLGSGNGDLVATVLVGTLLAELLALRPPRHARREATLAPRELRGIASRYVLLTYVVLVVAAAVYHVVNRDWMAAGVLGLSAVAVAVIIWAAVARPASGDHVVDMALRTRSVHVSAGLGAAVAGVSVAGWPGFIGILAWVAMANTKPPAATIVR
ncbi:hypothetical protein SAMN05216188_101290 [Lentzea xinjiangensis]|uniref:Uncharacterized protein n=1 Tax=Lentzea xinjiangensis TaxID=402600 RepID=A0A1H9A6U0_9PSEU|nr:hypothetical protein [Lentzea xinjiangensis]SEP72379.1 hypothetical protein SAMN05216188_101290 [Lentzea xinjiangensis]